LKTAAAMKNNEERLYDLEDLLDAAAGDKVFIGKMIGNFIAETGIVLQKISILRVGGDYAGIKAVLHKIKPTMKVMGIATVVGIIEEIEEMNLLAMNESRFSELFLKMEKTLTLVNEELGKLKSISG